VGAPFPTLFSLTLEGSQYTWCSRFLPSMYESSSPFVWFTCQACTGACVHYPRTSVHDISWHFFFFFDLEETPLLSFFSSDFLRSLAYRELRAPASTSHGLFFLLYLLTASAIYFFFSGWNGVFRGLCLFFFHNHMVFPSFLSPPVQTFCLAGFKSLSFIVGHHENPQPVLFSVSTPFSNFFWFFLCAFALPILLFMVRQKKWLPSRWSASSDLRISFIHSLQQPPFWCSSAWTVRQLCQISSRRFSPPSDHLLTFALLTSFVIRYRFSSPSTVATTV